MNYWKKKRILLATAAVLVVCASAFATWIALSVRISKNAMALFAHRLPDFGYEEVLPNSGRAKRLNLDEMMNREQGMRVYSFYRQNRFFLKIFENVSMNRTECCRVLKTKYKKLYYNKLSLLRNCSDFIEADIFESDRDAALKNLELMQKIASSPVKTDGDRADVSAVYMLARQIYRVISVFDLSKNDLARIDSLLARQREYVRSLRDQDDFRNASASLKTIEQGLAIMRGEREEYMDPWKDQGKLIVKYETAGIKKIVRIYSVGKNGIDENGSPYTAGVNACNDDITFVLLMKNGEKNRKNL